MNEAAKTFLECGDLSPLSKAPTSRRTPKLVHSLRQTPARRRRASRRRMKEGTRKVAFRKSRGEPARLRVLNGVYTPLNGVYTPLNGVYTPLNGFSTPLNGVCARMNW